MDSPVPYPLDYQITLARIIATRLIALPVPGREGEAVELQKTLHRLGDIAFGACGTCGAPIPFPELEANPTARRCEACSKGEH